MTQSNEILVTYKQTMENIPIDWTNIMDYQESDYTTHLQLSNYPESNEFLWIEVMESISQIQLLIQQNITSK